MLASFGKDVLGLIMSNLSIEDALSLARTCTRAHEVFCSRPHWAARLWREAHVASTVRPLHGKGAKKRNKQRKAQSGDELRDQYRVLHLNRRATYRSLTALARVMTAASARSVCGLIELNGADVSVPRRKFSARWGTEQVTCSYPVARVSTQTNELVLGSGTRTVFTVDIRTAIMRLTSLTGYNRYSPLSIAARCVPEEASVSVPFSEKQMDQLVELKILCRCGCLLWAPGDRCCQ